DALPQMFPNNVTPVLLQDIVFVKENKAGKSREMLGKASIDCIRIFMRSPGIQHFPATVATLVSLKEQAAAFKLKHGQKEEASKLFEKLVESHNSIEAVVGLIQTAAYTDVEKAKTYEKQLKPLPGLACVDVNALEKTSSEKHVENGIT
ncbi:signal recognition particle subunit SRP72, partial [Tanacetum coccineum]